MRVIGLGMLLLSCACGPGADQGASSSAPSTSTPASTNAGSASASATAKTSAAPPGKSTPDKLTSPIRENVSAGDFKDGVAFEARLFVSKLTPADKIHLALRFKLEKPLEQDDPLRKATMDAGELLPSLRFEVTSPSGKTTLETSEKLGQGQLSIPWFDTELALDGQGASQHGKLAAWKKPAPDLFAKPGKYGIAISGQLKLGDRIVPIALKPIELEIVEQSPSFKSLADLSADAAQLVQTKKGLAKPPQSFTAIIDDTDGHRWFRHQVDAAGKTGRSSYDVEIIETLLDPAGREINYDTFLHFTCVAEGVTIATPRGPVPVESLVPGDAVTAYDVAIGRKTIATVEHVQSAHAERLIQLGDLLVTGAHPIYVGGRFEPAAQLAPGSELLTEALVKRPFSAIELTTPATVFELSVSEPHTYFAGGVLVHNKAVYEPVGGQKQPYRGWFYRRAVKR